MLRWRAGFEGLIWLFEVICWLSVLGVNLHCLFGYVALIWV